VYPSVHPYMYYHYFIFRFGYYSAGSQQRSTAEMNECINEYVSAWLASPPPLHPHSPTPPLDTAQQFPFLSMHESSIHAASRSDLQHTAPSIPYTKERMYEIRGKQKFEILNAKIMCFFFLPPLQCCADIYNKHLSKLANTGIKIPTMLAPTRI